MLTCCKSRERLRRMLRTSGSQCTQKALTSRGNKVDSQQAQGSGIVKSNI